MQVPLANIFCNDAENRAEIGWAEKVQMVQKLVEVVEVAAVFVAWLQRICFAIGLVEVLRETAEKFCHGKVCFGVANVAGWIYEHGFAVWTTHNITAPEVSVQKAWFIRFY